MRGAPIRRTSGLSAEDLPAGTLAWGTLGMPSRKSFTRACTDSSSCSSAFSRSACALTSAISGAASAPFAFSWPTCFESWLRLAWSSCVSVCTALRPASSFSNSPTGKL